MMKWGSNGFDHPMTNSEEVVYRSSRELNKSILQTVSVASSVTVEYVSSDEQFEAGPLQETQKQEINSEKKRAVDLQETQKQETNPGQHPSAQEIFESKELNATSFPRRGLDHCTTASVGTHRYPLIDDHDNITFYRSMTEKRTTRHELKLDKLSECEKKKLIIELVKIQNDGTVEVDRDKTAPVASEFLELHSSVEGGASFYLDDSVPESSNKLIPRLKIAILVVGTRGDVQPFLAMAKRLQEFGHHVRLATHANFRSFVRSAGVEFYPLGGDPRVLAGYLSRNKGLIPSAPGEIALLRKQLKAIIESLLPACTEADMETGVLFRAQAIIANPPAYGHVHVAEALGVPIHIFFTMPWTPTYEFPHPLARIPQSAGYWLSYIVVDLLIWWGIRGYINDFRKGKLKLPPIAYFNMYHGSLSDLPTDWGPLVDVVGYCFLNLGSKYEPKEEFKEWIQKGTKPIYIGFGSTPLEDPKKTTDIIMEALKDTGQRGIIYRGWGDLGNLTEVPDTVFLLEDCPHDWLFPQCAALVHHGGAGTTAAGLKLGCPTTIVPSCGDQFFWGDKVHKQGLGPSPIPIAQLSVENLSNAIRFMLRPETSPHSYVELTAAVNKYKGIYDSTFANRLEETYLFQQLCFIVLKSEYQKAKVGLKEAHFQERVKSRAMELAKLIENEDGVAAAVDAFHRHLPSELPKPTASLDVDERPDPLQWFSIQLQNWCCLPLLFLLGFCRYVSLFFNF
ncbi:sterol 3-beta-glucosyltransferase UGT80B1 isoform X2 [Hevea brasiliensis]|uniref:sterol 3-beta-glucosyltransferase UGT80B1 isoform X2 n=1 Tax=Hevea brasiliensis TaxID=3981 RepID=UPI0025D300CF|nr:sterol 3-beta-glucosyltransferase UGT80B1 isoform X2 [Hevea brasiliensis]